MGGKRGRGDDDEKKREWLIEVGSEAIIKEKECTCLPVAEAGQRCADRSWPWEFCGDEFVFGTNGLAFF